MSRFEADPGCKFPESSTRRIVRSAAIIFVVVIFLVGAAVCLFELAVMYYLTILEFAMDVLSFGGAFWPPALLSLACCAINISVMQEKGRSAAGYIVGLGAFNMLLAYGAGLAYFNIEAPNNYHMTFLAADIGLPLLTYIVGFCHLFQRQ